MKRFPFVIEAIVFFACGAYYALDTIETEYIYKVVAEEYNLTSSSLKYCQQNHTTSGVEKDVAAKASRWMTYTKSTAQAANSVSALILASWSEKIGRKQALGFPVIGMFISTSFLALFIFLSLPLRFIIVCGFLNGIFGSQASLLDIGAAYLSDTVEKERLGQRFTILEICSSVGGGIVLIITGLWIKESGFVRSAFFLVGCSTIAIIWWLFLSNTRVKNDEKHELVTNREKLEDKYDEPITNLSNIWTQIKVVLRIYTSNISQCDICREELEACTHGGGFREGRVWRLWLYVVTYVTYMFVMNGIDVFQIMFFVSPPICFTPDLVGAQNGLDACTILFSICLVMFYQSVLKMNEQTILLTGISGRLTTSIVMYFSRGAPLIFIATSIGIFSSVTTPYIRLRLSSLVSSSEQGPVFALMSCINSIIAIFTPVAVLQIYPWTLTVSYSFIWLIKAMILLLPLLLMVTIWIADKVN